MNKKVSIGVLIAAVVLAIALTVTVTMLVAIRYFNATVSDVTQRQTMFDYVTDIDHIVRYNYVGVLDEEKLRQALGKGYIDGLGDAYAAYLTAEEYQAAQDTLKGRQTGFGLEVTLADNGKIVVTRVHQNSTADKAGLQKGDVLTAFNGSNVTASDYTSLNRTLNSASKVMLSVSRDNQTLAFEISTSTFDIIQVESRMLEDKVGYIRVYAIQENTPQQFRTAYTALEEQGATRFIFDLRDNTGGSPDAVEELLSFLVPSGAYAQQKDKDGKVTYLSSEDGGSMTAPSVTLVNGTTAGEAELFAGVLQELGKTLVVGETTAGKGLIQKYFTNTDGSAVRISVAERLLIKGGAIEGVGIQPDEESVLNGPLALTEEVNDLPLRTALRLAKAMGTTSITGGTTTTTTIATTTTATDTQTTTTTAE